jgi:hypothetical protein
MKKFLLSVLMSAALVGFAVPASALDVRFDPSGTAGASGDVLIDTLDPTVGNALAQNATIFNQNGDQLTVLFQANLGIASLLGDQKFQNGGLGYADDLGGIHGPAFVTFAAGFTETAHTPIGNTVESELNPAGPVNFFNIYVSTTAQGNNLTGSCFVCGTLALSGSFVLDPRVSNVSDFTINGGGVGTPLDGAGVNNYGGTSTLTGQGSFNTAIRINTVNSLYFPDITPGTVLTFILASSQELLNYQTVNPSACFSSNGIADCNVAGVASVGALNLVSGPNSMFQTDASLAFAAAPVPEPATLTLLGLGVLAGARRARKNRK